VIGQITPLVAGDPLRERPRRLLMLALYRSGRHAEALAAYRDACAALDEIGLQPSPELRRLEGAILRHDPLLAPPVSALGGHAGDDLRPAAFVEPAAVAADPPGIIVASPLLAAASPRREKRSVVTALFCEVTGSTGLGEELDPEVLHDVLSRCLGELRATITRHGGTVDRFTGDSTMAVFGIPRVHEDDALRAVRAAAEIRQRLPALSEETGVTLSFRGAVNTGLVLVDEEEHLAVGEAVSFAAQLQKAAAPGEILLGEETLRLVRDAIEVEPLERLTLKGKPTPVGVVRVLRVDPVAPGVARHFEVPLVGRTRELDLLHTAWDRAVEESGCHLFTLLGAAGVGKSRLVEELIATVGDVAAVLQGRCLPYGDGITFWPLIEALGAAGEPAAPVLERLRTGGIAAAEELFLEVRRLLESLAREQPVILHLDDLQWAEPMLLDLLDHVVELSRSKPILLLCSARPELLEDRPAWGGGKLNATAVLLEPLQVAECEALLDRLDGGLKVDERARIIAASEGNPLFLEEMAELARQDGTVAVPATIKALLAARLDRLATEDRELLELGAIEGEVFHRSAVDALGGERPPGQLDSRLGALVRHELIRPHPATIGGDEAFRFRHLLIRDAAYDGLPKVIRAELHERFASWLESNARELAELDELAGWHLEQTVRYLSEFGRVVEPSLALRAAEHLHAAGRRAAERADTAAARKLLERAHALSPDQGALGALIGVDLAEQLLETGDLTYVDELLSAAERDPAAATYASLARLEWMRHTRPQEASEKIESRLPGLLQELSRLGDERGLAKAHWVAFWVHWLACRATAAGQELRAVAEHALKAGDHGLRSQALGWYITALMVGRENAETIAGELGELEHEDPGPYLAAHLDLGRAELERLQGHLAEAQRLAHRAIERFGSLGMGALVGGLEQHLGQMELSAGEPAAAVASLQRSDAILAKLGERDLRSTTQALLAQAQELLANSEAARGAIALSDELGSTEDVANLVITHRVRARLALTDGDGQAAERWARSAVEHARRADFALYQAGAHLDLARVLAALSRPLEAASEARAALERYEAKGDRPGAVEARSLLGEVHRVA
jgi:class 3 adenylate cyclase